MQVMLPVKIKKQLSIWIEEDLVRYIRNTLEQEEKFSLPNINFQVGIMLGFCIPMDQLHSVAVKSIANWEQKLFRHIYSRDCCLGQNFWWIEIILHCIRVWGLKSKSRQKADLADTTQIVQFYSEVVGERSDYFTVSILCNLSLLEDQHQMDDLWGCLRKVFIWLID